MPHGLATLTKLLNLSLLLWSVGAVSECREDKFGNVKCGDRLSLGARIGIIIAIIVGVLLLAAAVRVVCLRCAIRRNTPNINHPSQDRDYYLQSFQPQGQHDPSYRSQQTGCQPGYGRQNEEYPPNSKIDRQSPNNVTPVRYTPSAGNSPKQ